MTAAARRDLRASYGILTLQALALVVLFALFARAWEFMDPFPRVFLFLLWIVAPVLLMALNTWVAGTFLPRGGNSWTFRGGALCFLASGAVIYSPLFLGGSEGQMDSNLVFLFGPFYHFLAATVVTAGYIGKSIFLFLGPGGGEG